MGILIMIACFIGLIVIHERGHMKAAKLMGVKVREFGIGIPPKIAKLRTDRSGTSYTLNAIPLGGFVRLQGDNPHDKKSFTESGSFFAASRWRKIIILIAGIVMNLIAARVILTIIFWYGIEPISIVPDEMNSHSLLIPSVSYATDAGLITQHTNRPALVIDTVPGSRAAQQNIDTGSIITMVDDTLVYAHNLSKTLQTQCASGCTITYQPPAKSPPTQTPFTCTDQCLLGVSIDTSSLITLHQTKLSLIVAMGASTREIIEQSRITMDTLGSMISTLWSGSTTEKQHTAAQLSGPVGIVGIGQALIDHGYRTHLRALVAMISIALALFNLLPIPALDGGRIAGALIQKILHIPAHHYYRIEGFINMIIMLSLMLVGILIMAKDASQIYCRDNTLTRTVFGNSAECIHKKE